MDIGAGKYVYNVEFPSNLPTSKILSVGISDGSFKPVNLSWSDTYPINGDQYVTNVEFPSDMNTVKNHKLIIFT